MYRVVIADDESIIRKGLRELVEWDALGLEVSGEAANGVEALEFVKSFKPHILITDIKMPEMDGISLIKAIKELGSDIKIIIISAHSDYAFLKKAIKLGVESYLLKPIDNDELTSNLADLVDSIEKEILQSTQRRQGVELLRTNTLNRLITNRISMEEFKEKAMFLGIDLEAEQYICAACSTEGPASKKFGSDKETALYAIHNICAEITGDTATPFIGPNDRIVFLFRGGKQENLRDTVDDALSNMEKQILKYLGIALTFGAGMAVGCVEDVWKSYDLAIKCLEYSMFLGNSAVIWYDRIERPDSQPNYKLDVNYELLGNLIRLGKKEEFFSYLDGVFESMTSVSLISADYVRNFMVRLVIRTFDVFKELPINQTVTAEIADLKYAELLSFGKINDFRQWFSRICGKMFDEAGRFQKTGASVVRNAISYIESHYTERLTLKQLADAFYINTSYLGQIFKRETGESFTNYINKYRIQKAKELLCTPGFKVYEVADKVGFTDYHYFLKIFKKIAGVNPTDIKNNSFYHNI